MKTHTFVTILYSVLTKRKAWKIRKKDSFEEYRSSLFDPQRLEKREEIFKNITLPSLASAFGDTKNSTILIFISSELPDEFKNRLLKLVEQFENIKIVSVDVDDNVFSKVGEVVKSELEQMGEDVLYSTIRLDDDDALSKSFLSHLEPYLDPKFIGFCVSFSSGVGLIFQNGRVVSAHKKKAPKIALGLAYINKYSYTERGVSGKFISVYNLGNHIDVEERVPTVIDPRRISWARSIHDTSDIYSSSLVRAYKDQPEMDLFSLDKYFDINV